MEYTKGEWTAIVTMDGSKTIVRTESGFIAVTKVVRPIEECEANANLIAASPDGLEAGIAAYKALLRTSGAFRVGIQEELCLLRDFIAKATNCSDEDTQNKYEEMVYLEGK